MSIAVNIFLKKMSPLTLWVTDFRLHSRLSSVLFEVGAMLPSMGIALYKHENDFPAFTDRTFCTFLLLLSQTLDAPRGITSGNEEINRIGSVF